jgi:hypothetical protein
VVSYYISAYVILPEGAVLPWHKKSHALERMAFELNRQIEL